MNDGLLTSADGFDNEMREDDEDGDEFKSLGCKNWVAQVCTSSVI